MHRVRCESKSSGKGGRCALAPRLRSQNVYISLQNRLKMTCLEADVHVLMGVVAVTDESRAHPRMPLPRRPRCASVWVNKTSPCGKDPDRMQRGSTSPLSRETDAPETIVKLECDIDDASPEVLAYAA